MLKVTRNFFVERTQGALILLAQDGIKGPRAWAGLFWFAMVSPGMFRKILGAWIRFFLPGFHPWNQDDRKLIAERGAKPSRKRSPSYPPCRVAAGRGTTRRVVEG